MTISTDNLVTIDFDEPLGETIVAQDIISVEVSGPRTDGYTYSWTFSLINANLSI